MIRFLPIFLVILVWSCDQECNPVSTFYKDGSLKNIVLKNCADTLSDYEELHYHPNGTIAKISHHYPRLDSIFIKQFYADGTIHSIQSKSNNQLSGEVQKWYPNGKLREKSFYVRGERKGKFFLYNKDGSIKNWEAH